MVGGLNVFLTKKKGTEAENSGNFNEDETMTPQIPGLSAFETFRIIESGMLMSLLANKCEIVPLTRLQIQFG